MSSGAPAVTRCARPASCPTIPAPPLCPNLDPATNRDEHSRDPPQDLRRSCGDVVAPDGLDLEVEPGTVFGLLGPNGAGKTTLVRVLATLLRPTAGRASVLGHDVVADPLAVRRRA